MKFFFLISCGILGTKDFAFRLVFECRAILDRVPKEPGLDSDTIQGSSSDFVFEGVAFEESLKWIPAVSNSTLLGNPLKLFDRSASKRSSNLKRKLFV